MDKVFSSENSWLDVSAPVHSGMQHWPGEPQVSIYKVASINKGDEANVSAISMSAHTGTHMDAPYHFLNDGKDISQIPLEIVTGKALVIELKNPHNVDITDIRGYDINPESRILFKTANSEREWFNMEFSKDYVALTARAARYLAEKRAALVGIDFLSIGTYDEDPEVHRTLLGSGIWIIEGLYLNGVTEGTYDMICLPLRLMGSDGAPARAVLRKI